jgi:hypothetical protein
MNNTTEALPMPTSRGDVRHVEVLIHTRTFGRVRDLRVERDANGLILRGQTTSYYVKQLAQQAVLEAGELSLLANEIQVISELEAPR